MEINVVMCLCDELFDVAFQGVVIDHKVKMNVRAQELLDDSQSLGVVNDVSNKRHGGFVTVNVQ